MRSALLYLIVVAASAAAPAQWQMQNSHTTADLRGILNVGDGVAWASGTNGTVLRTEDGGFLWQVCAVPPGAENLDFRGIQAFDADTAIVMSSGKGDLSRLYKTTDGCHSWKLVFANPDADGFWDAVKFEDANTGMILGDPVDGYFAIFITSNGGYTWQKQTPSGIKADAAQESIFAASNSSLFATSDPARQFFVTGGTGGAHFIECHKKSSASSKPEKLDADGKSEKVSARGKVKRSSVDKAQALECLRTKQALPLQGKSESAGAFSLGSEHETFVAVGGDFRQPDDPAGTAVCTQGKDKPWQAAKTSPRGYRSAVAFYEQSKTWITVGPNGTDISTDDGRNWRPLRPDPAHYETSDSAKNWNALSLPFVVGPHGRIGKLNEDALRR
jgi:photosystem II stability/assembly factor-like uncharacterized protein